MEAPLVSVIVPCRNEEAYVGRCIDSILASEYPLDRLEVLVVDGRSDDRTRDVVAQRVARYRSVRLLDNPKRITPCAMNIGVRQAKGDFVFLAGCHAVYPPAYVPQLVAAFQQEAAADAVGGVLVTLPAADTPAARAIALAMSHPLGVGNSHFRIGAASPRWVDTLGFSCYRREVFQRFGMFDEELVRSQDAEFNSRLTQRGGRILLVPAVSASYYARATRGQLARMFYQYGYFKPLVAQKLGRIMTVRQVVPPAFLLSLVGAAILSAVEPANIPLLVAVTGSYALAVLATAAQAMRRHGIRCALALTTVFPVMHLSFGLGFLRRSLELLVLRKRRMDAARMPLSR